MHEFIYWMQWGFRGTTWYKYISLLLYMFVLGLGSGSLIGMFGWSLWITVPVYLVLLVAGMYAYFLWEGY